MNRKEHLKISREVLGLAGNPEIHNFLDALPVHLHRITHNIDFIEKNIAPHFGKEGTMESWAHVMADWGLFDGILKNIPKREKEI